MNNVIETYLQEKDKEEAIPSNCMNCEECGCSQKTPEEKNVQENNR